MRYWMAGLTLLMIAWPIHLGMIHDKIGMVLVFAVIQGFVFWYISRDNAPHIPTRYQILFSQMIAISISFVGYTIGISIN